MLLKEATMLPLLESAHRYLFLEAATLRASPRLSLAWTLDTPSNTRLGIRKVPPTLIACMAP